MALVPDKTIDEIIAEKSGAREILHARGIDSCCSGMLTLRQAAELKGIPLDQLLTELESPGTREPRSAFPLFIRTALICTLTMGVGFGAYNLAVIHWALGPMPPAHNASHASFQIWGFVFLYILGVATRLFAVDHRHPRLVRSVLWLTVASLILSAYSGLHPLVPLALESGLVSATLQLAAVVTITVLLLSRWRRGRTQDGRFERFLTTGMIWWTVAALHQWIGAAAWLGDEDLQGAWNASMYAAALFGAVLAWIQGFFYQTAPALLGLRSARKPAFVDAAYVLALVGAVLGTAARWPFDIGPAGPLENAGLALTALSMIVFAAGMQIHTASLPDRSLALSLGLAGIGAGLFIVLSLAHVALFAAGEAHRLLFDGARHAFTLGFLTLMIFGLSARLVPKFSGTNLRWGALRTAGVIVIAVALLMRETQIAAAYTSMSWLLLVSGASGAVAFVGVSLASASLFRTLRSAA